MDAHTSGTLYYVCTDRVILKTEYRDDGGDRALWSPSATPTRAGIKRYPWNSYPNRMTGNDKRFAV